MLRVPRTAVLGVLACAWGFSIEIIAQQSCVANATSSVAAIVTNDIGPAPEQQN